MHLKEYVFKVVVLGDGSVGKTSLVLQYTEKKFSSSYVMTIGSNFAVKILTIPEKQVKVKFQLWDLAGQPHFQFIRPPFYRGALLAILVFDITNRESFENIQLWVKETKNNVGDIPLLVAGNKVDLADQRVVSKKEAEDLAKELNSYYFETSAKEDQNLDELMNKALEKIFERMDI